MRFFRIECFLNLCKGYEAKCDWWICIKRSLMISVDQEILLAGQIKSD